MLNKSSPLRWAMALAPLALCAQSATAAPDVSISGFGTLGYVITDTDKAEFRASPRQHGGATKSSGDWGVDSRLGVQANVTFNDTFSVVGQAFASRRDGKNSVDAEWLYLQADLSKDATVRLGRMVMPAFLLSDFRHVGYAQHWLRTPAEVYGAFLTTSFDGAQATFRHRLGDYHLTATLSGGKADKEGVYGRLNGAETNMMEESRALYSAALSVERGSWLGRIAHTEKHGLELAFDEPLDMGFFTIPKGSLMAEGKDKFTALGIQYDNGSLLAIAEHTWRGWDEEEGFANLDAEAFYATAGYRLGSVMPYATYSQMKPKGDGYPDESTRRTHAVGVRWDFMPDMALKVQYEEVSGSIGFHVAPFSQDFAESRPKIRAFSAALDFIF